LEYSIVNMNSDQIASSENGKPAKAPVRTGQSVIVRCAGFSCLAYCDRDGVWRSVFGNRPLPEILDIEPGAEGETAGNV